MDGKFVSACGSKDKEGSSRKQKGFGKRKVSREQGSKKDGRYA